jgi:hypothetical protein
MNPRDLGTILASPGIQYFEIWQMNIAWRPSHLNVAFEEIREIAAPALRHRLILNLYAESSGATADGLLYELIAILPE